LPAPIVLTAWNRQLQLQTYDGDTVDRFIRSFKGRNGVAPEGGGACRGTNATKAATP
jgi:hypothetical protein